MAGVIVPIAEALGITEAVWLAILGLLRLISWVLGIGYVSAKVTELGTGVVAGTTQKSQDATIEGILTRTDITAAQKKDLIDAYLATQAGKQKGTDWAQTLLIAVGILAAAYLASSFIGGKK